jgi:hypothetical protein
VFVPSAVGEYEKLVEQTVFHKVLNFIWI